MSNLFKPWTIQTYVEGARVINSDARITEYLDKSTKQRADILADVQKNVQEGTETGEFAEGLLRGAAVIKAEPEVDYAALARAEAEQILAEANAKAEELIRQANAQAGEIEETARNKGLEEGRTQLARELDVQRGQLEEDYRSRLQHLEQDYSEKRSNMEQELVDVILTVFNKVFHIQFDNKREILLHLIDDAIMNIEGEKKFRIKVAQSNVMFLESHKEEILDRVGHDVELEFLSDSTADGNACVIETDSGVFDCSLGTQLENLIKDIRTLSS